MKIYYVTIKYGYDLGSTRNVIAVAKTPEKVLEFCVKYAKKNYWNKYEVVEIRVFNKVDFWQK